MPFEVIQDFIDKSKSSNIIDIGKKPGTRFGKIKPNVFEYYSTFAYGQVGFELDLTDDIDKHNSIICDRIIDDFHRAYSSNDNIIDSYFGG